MASRKLQMRAALRREIRVLQTLTNSKSAKVRYIIADTILYILKLQLQLEAIKAELHYILNNIQEVKVKKDGRNKIQVKVVCKKLGHQDLLMRIRETMEEMDLSIVEVRVSCKYIFAMEAIVETEDQELSVGAVTLAILKTINLN